MMIFKTDRPNTSFAILKVWLLNLLLFSVPIIYDLLFPNNFIKDSYYYIAGSVLLMNFLIIIFTDRLYELQIDNDERQLVFLSKSLLSKTKKTFLSFDNGRLEIEKNKSRWFKIGDPLTLYFLHNKTEVFEITKSKDGFSIDTLNKIYTTVQEISLPSTNA
jgi:hypothetical protein